MPQQPLYAQPFVLADPPAAFAEAEYILNLSRQADVGFDLDWIASLQATDPTQAKTEIEQHYTQLVADKMRRPEITYAQEAIAHAMREEKPELDLAQQELANTTWTCNFPAKQRLPFPKFDYCQLVGLALVVLGLVAAGIFLAARTLYLATVAQTLVMGFIMVVSILAGSIGYKIAYSTLPSPKTKALVLRTTAVLTVLAWGVYLATFALRFHDVGSFGAEEAAALFSLSAPAEPATALADHWAWKFLFLLLGLVLEGATTGIVWVHGSEMLSKRRLTDCVENPTYTFFKTRERRLHDLMGKGRSLLAQLQGQLKVIDGHARAVVKKAEAEYQALHDEREDEIRRAEGYRAGRRNTRTARTPDPAPENDNGTMFCLNRNRCL